MFLKRPKDDKSRETWDMVQNASVVGLHLVSATFVGLLMGYWLDKWLGTKPWLTILLLVFGVAAGFKNVLLEAKKIQNAQEKSAPPRVNDTNGTDSQ
ncbi:AtpZ/AtpI family protein [Desulfovibrio inopinatus]|uniref:AtpZ/AtpI family protein n=1 Tax=Desulfovibrio inopinatus TaxID=102109 RepID=UPI0004233C56|nr:AtpZ/AtpI family protein [Desulfovibrio inopinatus]